LPTEEDLQEVGVVWHGARNVARSLEMVEVVKDVAAIDLLHVLTRADRFENLEGTRVSVKRALRLSLGSIAEILGDGLGKIGLA
jgi:hypothetical protein